jgi:hypothetical protein
LVENKGMELLLVKFGSELFLGVGAHSEQLGVPVKIGGSLAKGPEF